MKIFACIGYTVVFAVELYALNNLGIAQGTSGWWALVLGYIYAALMGTIIGGK